MAFGLFWVPLLSDAPNLDAAGERMLAVFLVALVLFVTEAIPLYATAAPIILLPPRICQPAMSSSRQRTAGAAASRPSAVTNGTPWASAAATKRAS